jgi:hypothetical protein
MRGVRLGLFRFEKFNVDQHRKGPRCYDNQDLLPHTSLAFSEQSPQGRNYSLNATIAESSHSSLSH